VVACFRVKRKNLFAVLNELNLLNRRSKYLSRYDEQEVVSHDQNSIRATPIQHSSQLLLLTQDIDVVGIDEAQFFDDELPNICTQLANLGIRVVVAGLDLDYLGRPFGPIPNLLALAEFVTKVHAICVRTGNLAHHSYRIVEGENLVQLGEKESYLPLSREAFVEAMANKAEGTNSKLDDELIAFVDEFESRRRKVQEQRAALLKPKTIEASKESI
jgi:thymidine kinase